MPATPELQRGGRRIKFILSKLKTNWVYMRLSPSNMKTQKRDAWLLLRFMALATLSNLNILLGGYYK